jgi:hypothetical protein
LSVANSHLGNVVDYISSTMAMCGNAHKKTIKPCFMWLLGRFLQENPIMRLLDIREIANN